MAVEVIARMAGENPASLSTLVQPGNADYLSKISTARAAAICAVRFDLDAVPSGHKVAAVGTKRRLEALAYMGWSLRHVAGRLGVTVQAVSQYRTRSMVYADTARAIRDLYDELWDQQGPSVRTRGWARREGWLPPLAWDDMDDPDATPHTASVATSSICRVDGGEVEHLAGYGLDAEQVADRLGVTSAAVERWLHRHGRYDLLEQLRLNRDGGATSTYHPNRRTERAS